jgi:branched-chain amino acid transport system substrate-binding protein
MRKIVGIALLVLITCAGCSRGPAAGDPVRIAFIGPLSGGVAANGLGGRNATDLAVRLRNADPNSKYRYQLEVLDDECKPNIGVQVATKAAASRRVVAAVAHYCSAVAMGTIDVYHKFGMPVVVWGAVLPEITYKYGYDEIHRVNGTMINQNEVAARFMIGMGYSRWAVIHDTTDYGKGHNKYFSEYASKYGGEIVGSFGVTADQQDFNAELTKIKELRPQVLYFGGLTPIGVRIRSQLERLGIKAVFQGTSGIVSDAYIQGLGDLAEGTIAFREGAPAERLPGGHYFLEQYEKQGYSDPPEAYGPFAFVAANLIMDAIEKVGPNRKRVTRELNATRDYPSAVGTITFDEQGQNMVPIITKFVVQDGKWTIWEASEYASGKRKLPRPS